MTPEQDALPSAPAPWPLWRRWLLNFGSVYLAGYFLLVGQTLLTPPGVRQWLHSAVGKLYEAALGQSWPPLKPTGSGDTALDWALFGLLFLASLAAGTLWTALQKRSPAWQAPALSGLLRFFLAAWLLNYGLIKFGFGQFGLLREEQLSTTYGESSPMGLLWRFMAASPGYQWLGGAAEVLPALLLLHRRTVTLGALLAAVTLTNIFALNLLYDVPVKLFSGHLLLAALVLAAAEWPRLWAFARGKAVPAVQGRPQPAAFRWGSWLLTALVLVTAGLKAQQGLTELAEYRADPANSQTRLQTRGFHPVSPVPFNR
ncbi:hypothetical protein Deipr_1003 [Deinococcus proteolyticus MRP]|uniref:DoxX family protein n=1 Tax=Deinococcus proteolyticus (strain ATCC 35074 / DSM 20540 / JCM 6276 / NBRC 101906 / NCIMB 13154 / VKM Ac-1939 / CCM 2703 / MRP) TaxID=693977 RepID=F0RN17_DEIPM|nr:MULTISPECIES: hypothetical protein [Deinococcus]ADY26159.1 hypothetical protein Deipr_1003 [Deinococcus proteolyticus MRP]MCY1702279.1 hypothetical protein [Deinococcus sp. SL84]